MAVGVFHCGVIVHECVFAEEDDAWKQCEVLVSMPGVAAVVSGLMPNLRFVQTYSAGLDGLLHPTMMVGTC